MATQHELVTIATHDGLDYVTRADDVELVQTLANGAVTGKRIMRPLRSFVLNHMVIAVDNKELTELEDSLGPDEEIVEPGSLRGRNLAELIIRQGE